MALVVVVELFQCVRMTQALGILEEAGKGKKWLFGGSRKGGKKWLIFGGSRKGEKWNLFLEEMGKERGGFFYFWRKCEKKKMGF